MHEDELKRELHELAARLDRLERRLGIPPATPVRTKPSEPVAQISTDQAFVAQHDAEPSPALAAATSKELAAEKCSTFKRLQVNWERRSEEASAPPTERTRPLTTPRRESQAPPIAALPKREQQSLEVLIGGKWMAWIGALTVLFAVGFAIMVSVKQGWWGRLSPELRCLAIAAFGAALLLGGEIALRKLGRAASVGLFSAGLGTLYMDAFATFRFFHLLSSHAAFALMAVVAVIGFAITLRTRFLTIGVLSILGGYLTPILLHGQSGNDLELLSFLTMLYAIALGLSAVLPHNFRMLRYVALGGQVALGATWIIGTRASHWQLAMFFASTWWIMTISEAVWAAIRRQTPVGNVAMAILGTAAFVVGGCWVLLLGPTAALVPVVPAGAPAPALLVSNWLGVFTLMVAMLSGALAWHFGPDIRELAQPVRSSLDKLALALWTQMGVLIVVAIALQFRGFAESLGYLAIALSAIELGRRLAVRGLGFFGLALLGIAIFRIVAIDAFATPGMRDAIWSLHNVHLTRWGLLALSAVIVLHVAAHRIWFPRDASRNAWAITLAALGVAGWLIVCIVHAKGLAVTAGWLFGGVALLTLSLIRGVGRRQNYIEIAMFVTALAAARWILIDAFGTRLTHGWNPHAMTPILNQQVMMALSIIATMWWANRRLESKSIESGRHRFGGIVQTLSYIFLLLVMSFEVDRMIARTSPLPQWLSEWPLYQARMLLFTALWAAGGTVMLNIGQRRDNMLVMAVGFVILAGAALLWLSVDTLHWRIEDGVVSATPILNLQCAVGMLVIAMLALSVRWLRHFHPTNALLRDNRIAAMMAALALTAAIGLLAGSLEIDRALAHDPMVRHVGWSVYWGLYGVALVLIGFWQKVAAVRMAGLALLAAVAGKVVLIDFTYLDDVPRVISTLIAGLLFIGTSMLYFKLSPRVPPRTSQLDS